MDQPAGQVLAAGSGSGAERGARSRRRSIGMCGWAERKRPFSPAYVPHQLARLSGFRLRRDRRHGLPHPRHAEHGAALTAPVSVECVKQEGKSKYTFPQNVDDPLGLPGARRDASGEAVLVRRPGGSSPKIPGVPAGELIGDRDINGSLFIGDKGMMTTGCYGERTRLVPPRR